MINLRVKSQAKCQIYFSRALKWGIVHLCTLNTSRDTMKFRKLSVFQFFHFCKKIVKSLCKIPKNAKIQKNDTFFSIISPILFNLHRHTIPYFKDIEKLFWPLAWGLSGLTLEVLRYSAKSLGTFLWDTLY